MPSSNPTLRIIVAPAIERHVIEMARNEGRSLSNMSARLLNEALNARIRAQARSAHHDSLVRAIRGDAAPKS
jgi:hypothetical protein